MPKPTPAIVGSYKEKEQCIELGFVEKMMELWRLTGQILEAKAEISASGCLAKYTHKAGETFMNKTMRYKSTYKFQFSKPRNTTIINDERNRAALIIYENYICQYKAIYFNVRDYDLMINVRLYQEIVVPYFQIQHGQFAAVVLTRSRANKMLRKMWDAFILRRDRIVLRENQKNLSDQ